MSLPFYINVIIVGLLEVITAIEVALTAGEDQSEQVEFEPTITKA